MVAIDGKTVRGSRDGAVAKSAIHMLSAWASGNQLILSQVKVANRSNGITAIPNLLNALDVLGCAVTIDARACEFEVEQVG